MAPKLSRQTSIFDVVFFVFKSLLEIDRQKKLKKFKILTRKPRSYVRILIYRTWPIPKSFGCVLTRLLWRQFRVFPPWAAVTFISCRVHWFLACLILVCCFFLQLYTLKMIGFFLKLGFLYLARYDSQRSLGEYNLTQRCIRLKLLA